MYISAVQLWTSGNYHWYLKQELYSPLTPDSAHSGRPQAIQWDPIVPLRLHVLTTGVCVCVCVRVRVCVFSYSACVSDGCYECYNWRWCVNKSSCLSVNNRCDVAVIDGGRERGGGETHTHTHTHTHNTHNTHRSFTPHSTPSHHHTSPDEHPHTDPPLLHHPHHTCSPTSHQ